MTTPSKVKSIELELLSAEEAMTALEVLDHDFYIYKDIATNRISVTYKRKVGGIGILDVTERGLD